MRPVIQSLLAALVVLGAALPAHGASTFVALDQGNGEILLEWPRFPGATAYRVERHAWATAPVVLEAGDHLNAMDIAGVAASYNYRLFAIRAGGVASEVARVSFQAPGYVAARVQQAQGRPPRPRAALGTNLLGVTYYSPQTPFVDVMKSASPWISGDAATWDNALPLDVDVRGWVRSLLPGQIARTLMLLAERYPAGRYQVRYKGQGSFGFGQAARVVPGSERPGELMVDVAPESGGLFLYIMATDPADYLRDIEVLMPGGVCERDPFTHAASAAECGARRYLPFSEYSASIVFYPAFAERLRSYGALRFMDWFAANGGRRGPNPVKQWAERTPLAQRTWATETGVPPEVILALANRLGAHAWLNIPHQSDDAYARGLAELVRERLDPALGVYVEYSNELWNPIFPQSAYAAAQGAAQLPAIDAMQYHALRTRNAGQLFQSVLGAPRVVTVLAAQATNPWTARRGMDYLTQRFGAGASGIEAIAIAPYFGVMPTPANAAYYTAMSLDAFFEHVRATALPAAIRTMTTYRALSAEYGLPLYAYEGGQHMVGRAGAENNDALTAQFHAFNRDRRVGELYLEYLDAWKGEGGTLFMHFTDISRYDKWGDWGSLEFMTQARSQAPKFDALHSFIERNPPWW
jgi:hypothetical protein